MAKKNTTRTIIINKTYTLTSSTGLQDELDIVERYITKTCLEQEALQKFAAVFNVKLEVQDA